MLRIMQLLSRRSGRATPSGRQFSPPLIRNSFRARLFLELLEERNAPDNLASSAMALDGMPGEPIDALTAFPSLPDEWGNLFGRTVHADSAAVGDAPDHVPLSAENLSIANFFSVAAT